MGTPLDDIAGQSVRIRLADFDCSGGSLDKSCLSVALFTIWLADIVELHGGASDTLAAILDEVVSGQVTGGIVPDTFAIQSCGPLAFTL